MCRAAFAVLARIAINPLAYVVSFGACGAGLIVAGVFAIAGIGMALIVAGVFLIAGAAFITRGMSNG